MTIGLLDRPLSPKGRARDPEPFLKLFRDPRGLGIGLGLPRRGELRDNQVAREITCRAGQVAKNNIQRRSFWTKQAKPNDILSKSKKG